MSNFLEIIKTVCRPLFLLGILLWSPQIFLWMIIVDISISILVVLIKDLKLVKIDNLENPKLSFLIYFIELLMVSALIFYYGSLPLFFIYLGIKIFCTYCLLKE